MDQFTSPATWILVTLVTIALLILWNNRRQVPGAYQREARDMSQLYNLLWTRQQNVFVSASYPVPPEEERPPSDPTADKGANWEEYEFESIDLPHAKSTALLPNLHQKMLVRLAYREMYELFESTTKSYALVGSPGIGKTYFLSYALVRRLLERKPTTYQESNSSVHWFSGQEYCWFPSSINLPAAAFAQDVWHLVDSNNELESIPTPLSDTEGKIVQATPPAIKRYQEWVKQRQNIGAGASVLYLEPLTWQELYVIASNFAPQFVPRRLRYLSEAFQKYGPISRVCLQVAGNEEETEMADHAIHNAILALPANRHWATHESSKESNNLFCLHPTKNRVIARPLPLSIPIWDRLLDHARNVDINRAEEMLASFTKLPDFRTTAGHMFESIVLGMLQDYGGAYNITRLHPPKDLISCRIEGHGKVGRLCFWNAPKLRDVIRDHPGKLIKAQKRDWPSIDALMCTNDDKRVWVFQVMSSKEHSISASGMELLSDGIPADYKPTVGRKWIYVFITLDGTQLSQVPIQAEDEKTRKKWAGLLDIYVLQFSIKGLSETFCNASTMN